MKICYAYLVISGKKINFMDCKLIVVGRWYSMKNAHKPTRRELTLVAALSILNGATERDCQEESEKGISKTNSSPVPRFCTSKSAVQIQGDASTVPNCISHIYCFQWIKDQRAKDKNLQLMLLKGQSSGFLTVSINLPSSSYSSASTI